MEDPINCIILDDEPFAVNLLEDYAKKVSTLNVIYAGSDVYKALELLDTQSPDLIFIDLQMPELTGMELMKMANNRHNFIITSAYQEYALEAFKFKVLDFLVKPITFQRFHESIQKFMDWRESFSKKPEKNHLFVRAERKLHRVQFDSILYIEGLKDYIRIHTLEHKIIVHENMKDILKKLPEQDFVRIHRSYIIAVNRISIIDGNQIKINDSIQLPIGETYRKELAERFEE